MLHKQVFVRVVVPKRIGLEKNVPKVSGKAPLVVSACFCVSAVAVGLDADFAADAKTGARMRVRLSVLSGYS